ncbi:MAG: hypothetical protein U1E31_03170 [Rickettsiales bacterium]
MQFKKREPIFHYPERFGFTKKDIIKQMHPNFWEVGASGNVYTKKDVIEILLSRYNDPNYQENFEAKDFLLTKISKNNYLITYTLIQDKVRYTKRATLWRKVKNNLQILYHQGTIISTYC